MILSNALCPDKTPPFERDEVYITRNPLIRFLARRFRKTAGDLLVARHSSTFLGLDAGCGEGALMGLLRKQGCVARGVGIDCDERKIRFAARTHVSFTYCVSNVCSLNLKNGVFDYVIASEVLEHLAHPDKAMEELVRVAKPGALIILSVPLEPLFRFCNVLRGKYVGRLGKTPTHCNFWTPREFRMFAEGYVLVEQHFTLATFPWQILAGTVKPA